MEKKGDLQLKRLRMINISIQTSLRLYTIFDSSAPPNHPQLAIVCCGKDSLNLFIWILILFIIILSFKICNGGKFFPFPLTSCPIFFSLVASSFIVTLLLILSGRCWLSLFLESLNLSIELKRP